MPEQDSLRAHGQEYSGQWAAALNGESSSAMVQTLAGCDEARAKGVQTPQMFHIPDELGLPSAFWVYACHRIQPG
jgi:hypothetical protein